MKRVESESIALQKQQTVTELVAPKKNVSFRFGVMHLIKLEMFVVYVVSLSWKDMRAGGQVDDDKYKTHHFTIISEVESWPHCDLTHDPSVSTKSPPRH